MAGETTEAADQPFRFSDLPAELRDNIYELVVYHHANEGFIAPVSDVAGTTGDRSVHPENDFPVEMYPFRARIQGREVMVFLPPTADAAKLLEVGGEAYAAQKQIADESGDPCCEVVTIVKQRDEGPRACFAAHVCRKSCLCQPAITRVSRKMRKESLPIFYGLNAFDFQIMKWGDEGMQMARKWARAMIDVNLRLLKRFSLVVWANTSHPIPLRYSVDISKHAVTTTLTTAVKKQGKPFGNGDEMAEDLQTYVDNAGPEPRRRSEPLDRMLAYAGRVEEEGGLFVRAIEKILDGFECRRRSVAVARYNGLTWYRSEWIDRDEDEDDGATIASARRFADTYSSW